MARSRLPTRPISRAKDAAVRIARGGGVHGSYVHNAVLRRDGGGRVFEDEEGVPGMFWVGAKGNLVIVASDGVDGDAVAECIIEAGSAWRIAMGPHSVLDALRRRYHGRPLVFREQIYLRGDASSHGEVQPAVDARLADRRDHERLVKATLELNRSDLSIDPARVDRRWLYDTIAERVAAGITWVTGAPGQVSCKLDVGSDGPAGTILEGVFTFPESRGQGLASGLVAAFLARASRLVALHVAADNTAARRAYERAGMVAAERCWLLLTR